MIRKALLGDIKAVAQIYEHIHEREQAGELRIGWQKGVYPVEDTARDAYGRGELFVMEISGEIAAAAIINKTQVPVYADCQWQFDAGDDEIMVLHTLVVEPSLARGGAGTAFVAFYEAYARQNGCKCLRMDTNAINAAARALYKKLGYREAGILPCQFNGIEGVKLVCLEKRL